MKKVCFVSVSGGKDSTLTLALALKKYQDTNVPVIPFFCDTGWEHPLTYAYLETLEEVFGLKIKKLVGFPGGMVELVRKKKIFPSPRRRFCTQYLKVKPAYDFYNHMRRELSFEVAEVWVGIRRDESIYRRETKDKVLKPGKTKFGKQFDFELRFIYPIKDFSTIQVFRELKQRGIPVNPLYEMGYARVGCFPCFISRTDILTAMLKAIRGDRIAQERIQQLRDLEKELKQAGYRTRIHVDYNFDELWEITLAKSKQLELKLQEVRHDNP